MPRKATPKSLTLGAPSAVVADHVPLLPVVGCSSAPIDPDVPAPASSTVGHTPHTGPPQSTPVSCPSWMPSPQLFGWQTDGEP